MYGRLSRPQNYSRSLLPSFLTAPLFPASVCLKRLSDHSKVPTPAKTCPSRGRNSIKVSVDFPYSRSLTDARPNPSYAYAQQIKTDLCVRPAAPRVPVRTQRRTQKASAADAQLCKCGIRGHDASCIQCAAYSQNTSPTPTRSSTMTTAGDRPTSMCLYPAAPGASNVQRSRYLPAPYAEAPSA